MADDKAEARPKHAGRGTLATWVAIGAGMGAALGVALGNIAVWMPVGVGIGAAIGAAAALRRGHCAKGS